MRYEIRIAGSGGQGIIVAGIILAEAGIFQGYHVIQSQNYGPEARGGASVSEVIISDAEIDYPKTLGLDMLLLQEVDTFSYRSFRKNQFKIITENLSRHQGFFIKNYDVLFAPLPPFRPMGRVVSGLAFFSKYRPVESWLYSFDEDPSWPTSLFKPDRCFTVTIYILHSGKKLYVIHTHNSAFDDSSMRNAQVETLYKHMLKAYSGGHYVIAAGDWNINPKGYEERPFLSGDIAFSITGPDHVGGPGDQWQIVFDPAYPSNRDVSTPYTNGQTPTTILDFFVCSPNINVQEVKTLYNNFRNADHHPVYLRFGFH